MEIKSNVINLSELKDEEESFSNPTIPGSSTPKKSRKLLYLLIFILIIGAIAGSVAYFLVRAKSEKTTDFYLGKWQMALTNESKAAGLKELVYEFGNNKVTEELTSEATNITSIARLSAETKISQSDPNFIIFEQGGLKIDSLTVNINATVCKAPNNCDELKKNHETEFKRSLDEQNTKYKNQVYKLTKISNDQIRIEPNTLLTKISK
jgi:hypothetical protein